MDEKKTFNYGEDSDAGKEKTSNDEKDPSNEEEETVCVGSISHVIQTSFRDYYTTPHDLSEEGVENEEVVPKEEDQIDNQQEIEDEPVDSTEEEAEEMMESPEGGEEVEDEERSNSSDFSSDSGEMSGSNGLQEDNCENGNKKRHRKVHKDESVHPFMEHEKTEIDSIRTNLQEKLEQARTLLTFLDEKHIEAKDMDLKSAIDLKEKGLVVKAQIPISESKLNIQNEDLIKFGGFGSDLINAREIMIQNNVKILDRSGNGLTAQLKASQYVAATPGYLKETSSLSIRSSITKEKFLLDDKSSIKTKPNKEKQHDKQRVVKPVDHVLSADEKKKNMKILSRMQSNLNFQRNPRFDDTQKSSGLKTLSNDSSMYFAVIPPQIEFTSYESGGIYEQTLFLKNICAVSRRVRILPPSTRYFSIASIHFPDSSGLIAPGMSCRVIIQFAPDTRADFNDSVNVQTEGNSFSVQVLGKRDPPILSIPRSIDLGCSLLGKIKRLEMECKNTGGKATFWILKESEWPEIANTDSPLNENSSILHIGSFSITPTVFELGSDESVLLNITYSSKHLTKEIEKIVMVCDNCQVKHFELHGEGIQVDLSISMINSIPLEGSVANVSPIDLILFDPQIIASTTTQDFDVLNNTPIDLPFTWELEPKSNIYSILPISGNFCPNSSIHFSISFKPKEDTVYNATASLLVSDVSEYSIQSPKQTEMLERLLQIEDLDSISLKEVPAFGMSLCGIGCMVNDEISLIPPVLFFPQKLTINTPLSHTVSLSNQTASQVHFRWKQGCENITCEIQVKDSAGTIEPFSKLDFEVVITPLAVGVFDFDIGCTLSCKKDDVNLKVSGEVEEAKVQFMSPEINFGLVSVGGSISSSLKFKNGSKSTIANWKCVHVEGCGQVNKEIKRIGSNESLLSRYSMVSSNTSRSTAGVDIPPKCVVQISPDCGSLLPNTEVDIQITCQAGRFPERFRGSLECEVENGKNSYLSMRAEVQSPNVYLTPTAVDLGITYVGVPVYKEFNLINLSNLKAPFKWLEPQGKSKAYDINFSPKKGVLISKEARVITVEFIARTSCKTTALFACNIRGMFIPLGFELSTLQRGLVISYSIIKEGQNINQIDDSQISIPKLNFGENVDIFQRTKLSLLVQNLSGIDAKIKLEAKKYPAYIEHKRKSSRGKFLLSNKHEEIKLFNSDEGMKHAKKQKYLLEDRKILKNGGGVAFLVDPSDTFVLPPWEKKIVTITCFNNMSGKYVDDICCIVDGLPPTRLNAKVNIVGCPLSLDMNCIGLLNNGPILPSELNWGECFYRSGASSKFIKVVNTGPITAKLRWKVKAIDDDNKLVDLKLHYDNESKKVFLKILPHIKKVEKPLFEVIPVENNVSKHSSSVFEVKFASPDQSETEEIFKIFRAKMVADAEWIYEKAKSMGAEMPRDQTTKRENSTAGKAINAVRMMSRMMITQLSEAKINEKSENCLELYLASKMVSPYLSLDKHAYEEKPVSKSLHGQHRKIQQTLKFTAWSIHTTEHASHSREISLVNRMSVDAVFYLKVEPPFTITAFHTLAPKHPLMSKSSSLNNSNHKGNFFKLPPGQSVQATVLFLAAFAVTDKQKLKEEVESKMTISFSNSFVQEIILRGILLRPMVSITPSEYSFGTVHIEGYSEVVLYLVNPTQVDAIWTIRHIPAPIPKSRAQKAAFNMSIKSGDMFPYDDPSVFNLSSIEGVLKGPTLPLSSTGYAIPSKVGKEQSNIIEPFPLKVSFKPTKAQRYRCRFRVEVHKGENFDMVLEGIGTLSEVNQFDKDRPMLRTEKLAYRKNVFN